MLRSTGLNWDLRVSEGYDCYNLFNFNIPIGGFGDSFDRYLMRFEEMRQSLNIMTQALKYLCYYTDIDDSAHNLQDDKAVPPSRVSMKTFMESLIRHFKIYSEGFCIPREDVYSTVEAPKGELGMFVASNDSNMPDRSHIKAPGFLHLGSLGFLSEGAYLADLVTIIGTLDLVFGEIDR